jgi:hypothetical protein
MDKILNAFLDKIVIPNLKGRYKEISQWKNNWVFTIQEALMQIAIFRNDKLSFNWVKDEFKKSFETAVEASGKNTETTRDMIHCQFQIASQVQICEMCFHQGVFIYSMLENRLCKSVEYHAYILNGGVPKNINKSELHDVWFMDCVWEIVYNHFNKRKDLPMPETKKLLSQRRPEMITFNWGPAILHYTTQ